MLRQPFHLKQRMTHVLPHHGTKHQQRVNNIWSCILGNQGFVRMNAVITELLTTCMAKYAMYRRQNTYSKIINVVDSKTSKKRLLAAEYLVSIIYNYPTSKTRALYKSTDRPAGRPGDNPPNSDVLDVLHRTVRKMTIWVYWQPGAPIWQLFGSDPDPDPKWQSGTVPNTSYGMGY